MAFFWLGTAMVLLKLLGFPGITLMSWWWVLVPYGLAVAWWSFADATGITQRQVMDRLTAQAQARRQAQYERLGMRIKGKPRR